MLLSGSFASNLNLAQNDIAVQGACLVHSDSGGSGLWNRDQGIPHLPSKLEVRQRTSVRVAQT